MRNANQFRTDVDSFHRVAEARKVFAQPSGAAADIENFTACGQCQSDGDIREVTEMTKRFRVHAFTGMVRWLVREIVERLGKKIMTMLRIELVDVIDRRLAIVDALQFSQATVVFIRSRRRRRRRKRSNRGWLSVRSICRWRSH